MKKLVLMRASDGLIPDLTSCSSKLKNEIGVCILKQGLHNYPPIATGPVELYFEYIPDLESRGEIIMMSWELGKSGAQYVKDTSIRYPFPPPNQNMPCRRNVCIRASMRSRAQKERILRSEHPIKRIAR
ncbi:hypothetical protein QUB17_08960 [Microcoleus sp. B5-C4]